MSAPRAGWLALLFLVSRPSLLGDRLVRQKERCESKPHSGVIFSGKVLQSVSFGPSRFCQQEPACARLSLKSSELVLSRIYAPGVFPCWFGNFPRAQATPPASSLPARSRMGSRVTRAEGLARKTEKQQLTQLLYLHPALAPCTWSGGVRARVCPAPLLAQHEGVPCRPLPGGLLSGSSASWGGPRLSWVLESPPHPPCQQR